MKFKWKRAFSLSAGMSLVIAIASDFYRVLIEFPNKPVVEATLHGNAWLQLLAAGFVGSLAICIVIGKLAGAKLWHS